MPAATCPSIPPAVEAYILLATIISLARANNTNQREANNKLIIRWASIFRLIVWIVRLDGLALAAPKSSSPRTIPPGYRIQCVGSGSALDRRAEYADIRGRAGRRGIVQRTQSTA